MENNSSIMENQEPRTPVHSKYPFSISRKVWLSLSIMIIAYLASMIIGFILGIKTESRLQRVSEAEFPAAVQSKVVATKFADQVKWYKDAVVFGERDFLVNAQNSARDSQAALKRLADLVEYDQKEKNTILTLLNQLSEFTTAADALYAGMLSDIANQELAARAQEMTERTNRLRDNLTALTETFSNHLKSELDTIGTVTRNQRYWNLVVFFIAVSVSLLLVSLIIFRAVTRPLQQAAALAAAMAEGDLSRKLEIHQQDEIGELARAMNAMAEEIEAAQTLLEQKVADRTASLEESNQKLREEVAERKRTEIELKKAQENMLKAVQLAEEANKGKTEFLANMSHEIRTPLTGVLGMTEILLGTPLSPEQRDYIETITVSGETLLSIINDILDISKIEAGEFTFISVPFDLKKTIEKISRIFNPLADKKGLALEVDFQPDAHYLVSGDETRIRQIIFNLLGNALKFTHQGRITLRVNTGEMTGNVMRYHIEIEDTGIGIKPEFVANIFNKFSQGDSSATRKYGGSGLGLFITRQLLEMMGGSISVKSALGKGSLFTLQLPLPVDTRQELVAPLTTAEPPAVKKTTAVPKGKKKPLKILLAEDNPINQKFIAAIIKRAGHKLTVVDNGKAAVEKVKNGSYSIVLMDIQMPEMNGLDATLAIRQAGIRDLPVIAMTASAYEQDRQMCLEAGMNDFIAKPLKQAELLFLISKWSPV